MATPATLIIHNKSFVHTAKMIAASLTDKWETATEIADRLGLSRASTSMTLSDLGRLSIIDRQTVKTNHYKRIGNYRKKSGGNFGDPK